MIAILEFQEGEDRTFLGSMETLAQRICPIACCFCSQRTLCVKEMWDWGNMLTQTFLYYWVKIREKA